MKFLTVLAAAAILLTPACAMARTNFCFSLNLVDFLRPPCRPVMVAPPPPAVYYYRPMAPCHNRVIVKEYHHYYHTTPPVEELTPQAPAQHYPPYNPYHQ